jgi:DNA-binding GntR family transcriptional regulator
VSVPPERVALGARTTLVDDIVEAVRERIVAGELEPGLKIRQQELAERLGVSRTPLREAFQKLEAEGWVDLRARHGAEVRPLTVGEAQEIFSMRVVLETAAAGISALRHATGDEPAAAALIDPAVDAGPGMEDANGRFHRLVYGLGGGYLPTELEATLERYWSRALRYRLVYWSRSSAVQRSREAHEALYAAWASRDAAACERATAEHILTALEEITARIDPSAPVAPTLQSLRERYRLGRGARGPGRP